ncbi:hypothetical protein PBT90_05475 [Algoriphagus halophytocola]|uniref:Uncharacterized protein n=1 Tax=Algoriphagus halophytocola TaxID=2991499 RepID=A0ABY6MKD1_9BACT|nr:MULTISPECIES: hypothetical protein [unclassified Algoriphagus]UZD22867.1 hypothetical protein OM944_19735 [Algoriphagus sp. TR-M5]WBL44134.1 hypothetical protein PBT90_05475 [Algoriphagus sp. TR-M9]
MKNRILLSLTISFFVCLSCTKEEDSLPQAPQQTDPLEGYNTYPVALIFPEGTQPDLSAASLWSWDKSSEVDGQNQGKVMKFPSESAFSYLFDGQNRLLLVGLVDEEHQQLDLNSTAKTLLYWGLSGPFFEPELASKFFEEVESFPIWQEWKTMVEQAYQDDPYFLADPKMGELLGKLIGDNEPNFPDARVWEETKASDLLVNGNIKSGLQVYQTGLSQFEVANTFRRRVTGFLYKTKKVNEAGQEEEINEFPASNNSKVPDQIIEIPVVTGITSFSGTVYDYLLGNTEKSFRVNTDPIEIPLNLDEKEATWQLRTIGMGKGGQNLNQTEIEERTKLIMLTFTLDFVVPLIADGLTAKATASKNTGAPKTQQDFWEAMTVAVAGYVDQMPSVSAKIQNGELSEAVRDFFTVGYNQFGSIFLEDLARVAAEVIWENAPANLPKPSLEDFSKSAVRKAKILTTIDLMLKGSDYARKVHDIQNSRSLEVFEITAKEIEINLEPRDSNVSPGNTKELSAFIKSSVADGQVIEYEWSTTGKYGYLFDDIHEGNSFSSSKRNVQYFASVKAGSVPEDAVDTVRVSTYIKQGQNRTKIGQDQAIIQIQDKIQFIVGWEIFVPVNKRETPISPTGVEYTISNGGFEAKFTTEVEPAGFQFQVIRQDGTRGNIVSKSADEVGRDGAAYVYKVGVGSIRIVNTYREEVKDEWLKKFTEELEARRNVYHSLEVTVIPKE